MEFDLMKKSVPCQISSVSRAGHPTWLHIQSYILLVHNSSIWTNTGSPVEYSKKCILCKWMNNGSTLTPNAWHDKDDDASHSARLILQSPLFLVGRTTRSSAYNNIYLQWNKFVNFSSTKPRHQEGREEEAGLCNTYCSYSGILFVYSIIL